MFEIRFARKGELTRQKELWKFCFGDPDNFIDFFYTNRYKEDKTILLVENGDISAMLTMIPIVTVTPDNYKINSVMLYAIATDPNKQNKGLATKLLNFCDQYLKANKLDLSVIVPATGELFNFYSKRGYQNGFYVREIWFKTDMLGALPVCKPGNCTILLPIIAEEYNRRRNKLLSGNFYIAYEDEDIEYQKKLSALSGADIYGIGCKNIQGCAAIERISADRVIIKELLIPEEFFAAAMKLITRQLHAKEYILRAPACWGEQFGGIIRPFAMVKKHQEIDVLITPENPGYLGIAFD